MASLDIKGIGKPLEIAEPARPEWPWLLRPCDPVPLDNIDEIAERANDYFTRCYEYNEPPKLTGLALAVGVPGPASLQRLAQRRPELRWMISRCMTAVAHSYESMIAEGSSPQGPMFMLKHLPEFDLEEPAGSKPLQYWNERREVIIDARVSGVKQPNEGGAELTPYEAYMKIIHGEVDIEDAIYEDIPSTKTTSSGSGPDIKSLEQLLAADTSAPVMDE